MKTISSLLAAILFIILFIYYNIPRNPVEHLQKVSVGIQTIKNTFGSGTIKIFKGEVYIWTVNHILKKHEKDDDFFPLEIVQKIYENGGVVATHYTFADVIAHSEYYDLALLKLRYNQFYKDSCSFYNDKLPPKLGEEVWSVGSPHGIDYMNTTTHGYISQYDRDIREGPLDQISCPVNKGASGSGAFLNDGRLIGIVSMMRDQNNMLIIPVRYIVEWAKSNKLPPELYN